LNVLHRKDGNPFNTSIVPSTQPSAAPTPLPAPSTGHVPSKEPAHSSNSPGGSSPAPASGKNKVSKGQMGTVPQKLGEPKIKEVTEIKEPPVKL
jgi:hypothetical protein